MTRIQDPRFVSVNGIALPKGPQHLDLSPGAQDVEIRFALPETNEQSAKLRFRAHAKSFYTVTFETFPHAAGRIFTNYNNTGAGGGDMIGVPIWLAYNLVAQSAYEAKERKMAVSWTKIDVISADPTEGTVASTTVKGSAPLPQN